MITQERLNRLKVINSGTNDARSVAVLELVSEVESLRSQVDELTAQVAALTKEETAQPEAESPRKRQKPVFK